MSSETSNSRPSRSTEAFYGRRHGKAIRPQQAAALEAGLRAYGLDLAQPAPADLRSLFAAEVSAVRLEIGFGGGEHLRHEATANPRTGFIGVEPFVNGMAKMMTAATAASLANLRTFPWVKEKEDAGDLTLRGAFFAISDGILHLLDEETGTFAPAA